MEMGDVAWTFLRTLPQERRLGLKSTPRLPLRPREGVRFKHRVSSSVVTFRLRLFIFCNFFSILWRMLFFFFPGASVKGKPDEAAIIGWETFVTVVMARREFADGIVSPCYGSSIVSSR